MRIPVIITTFEPHYQYNEELEAVYRRNFQSWISSTSKHSTFVVLTDFASSEPFKKFLRAFVEQSQGDAILLDGAERLNSHIAVNVALRHFRSPVVFLAASDTRPNTENWLDPAAADLLEKDAVITYFTVTYDGSHSLRQLQQSPLNEDSYVLREFETPNMIAGGWSEEFMAPYDYRIGDKAITKTNDFFMWQRIASEKSGLICFRCNVIHDQAYDKGRYNRGSIDNDVYRLRDEEERYFRVARTFLGQELPMLWPKYARPRITPVIRGFREDGIQGAIKEIYIRILQSRLLGAIRNFRKHSLYQLLFQLQILRSQKEALLSLRKDRRYDLIRALFFEDIEMYDSIAFEVVGQDGSSNGQTSKEKKTVEPR